MKALLSIVTATGVLIITSGFTASAQDIAGGKEIFTQTCGACHTIGRGRLVGPDLVNIHARRTEDWILKFVKSSQSVIKSGDEYADSLFQTYNRLVMPDQPNLGDDQIKDIISYIKDKSSESAAAMADTQTKPSSQVTTKTAGDLFSTTNMFLFGVILFMLIVIWSLARINKNLLEQIKDYYSSNSSFY